MLKTWCPSCDEIIESLASINLNMGQSTQLRLVEQVHRYLFSLVILCISTSPKSSPPQRCHFFVFEKVSKICIRCVNKIKWPKNAEKHNIGVGSQVLRSWPRPPHSKIRGDATGSNPLSPGGSGWGTAGTPFN